MAKNLDSIIQESVKRTLLEMDLVPVNQQGEANLVKKQSVNAWRMIYRLMDNVKSIMNNDYKAKNGNISNKDVDYIIDYIYDALKNITRNTIGGK